MEGPRALLHAQNTLVFSVQKRPDRSGPHLAYEQNRCWLRDRVPHPPHAHNLPTHATISFPRRSDSTAAGLRLPYAEQEAMLGAGE